jgi:tRNA-modifying protein YgfZ
MNNNWQSFIEERSGMVSDKLAAAFPPAEGNQTRQIYPLTHFGALCLFGPDAAKLLQGQITCDVNDISHSQSKMAAMCNAKGRVIATFLLVRYGESFMLILPDELIDIVQKKLQMYVLRSAVEISNVSGQYGFLGISEPEGSCNTFEASVEDKVIAMVLPGKLPRKLLVGPADKLINFWNQCRATGGFSESESSQWRLLDVMSGLPWLTLATSEEYIPQMLNLDKLGGISFTKGCYTGQEIVARTHYLGKSKREMVLATCVSHIEPSPNAAVVLDGEPEQQAVGHVLTALHDKTHWQLLLILQVEQKESSGFRLRDNPEVQLQLIPFSV